MDNYAISFGCYWKRLSLLSIAIIAFLQFTLSGCDEAPKPKKQEECQISLTMGTSADMPPFEFYRTGNEGAHIVGYDIDLGKAIGKQLGEEVQVKDMNFSVLIPALQAGRANFVMSSMSPTPERQKNIDFSQPYLSFGINAVTQNSLTVHSAEDLKGKRIGVQLGSTFEQLAQQWAKNDKTITIVSFNKLGDLIQALIIGRIDAALMESVTASSYVKLAPQLKNNPLPQYKVEFAIAFAKGSPLLEKFNQALDQLKSSGELDQIKKKWLGKD